MKNVDRKEGGNDIKKRENWNKGIKREQNLK